MHFWVTGVFGRNFVYNQDSGTAHTACDMTAFFTQSDLEVIDGPVPSQDMNPIAHV